MKKSESVEGADQVKDTVSEQVWSSDSFVRVQEHSFPEGTKEKVPHSSETGQPYLRAMNHAKIGESKSDNWAAKCSQPKTAATVVGVAIRAYN